VDNLCLPVCGHVRDYSVVPYGARPVPADVIAPRQPRFVADFFVRPADVVAHRFGANVAAGASNHGHEAVLVDAFDSQEILVATTQGVFGTAATQERHHS